jgi:PII-like signaling protein
VGDSLKALLVLLNEGMTYNNKPLFREIVDALRSSGIAGASIFRGIAGYGRHGGFISSDPFHGHGDSPIAILIIDSEENIKKAIKIVKRYCEDAFMVKWDVEEAM